MAAKKPKLNFIIVCDDIRQEIGNKFSFIGIYMRDIFVPKLPFIFPKLCFAVRFGNIDQSSKFEAKLIDPKGNQLVQSIKGVSPDDKPYNSFDLQAFFSPLKINEEGEYKFIVQFADDIKYGISFFIKLTSQKKD